MFRSDWGLVAIPVVWLLLAAIALATSQHPAPQYQRISAADNSLPAEAVQPPDVAYPDLKDDACYKADNHDVTDRCTQWRATLAAEETAQEAKLATKLSIISIAVSFVGIVLILKTLGNEHTAQRPYIFLFRTLKKRDDWTNEIIEIQGVNFRNVGKSFAYIEALTVRSCYADKPPKPKSLSLERYPPSSAMIPDEEWPFKNAVPITREGQPLHRPPTCDQRLFVQGRMLYRDAYNRRYHLWFSRVYSAGTFAFAPNELGEMETEEYNGTERLWPITAWCYKRNALNRTA